MNTPTRPLFLAAVVAAVFAAVVAATPPAGATILRQFDLHGLSRAAQVVVRGKVLSQEARWNADRTRIYRYSTVEVLERVKGARRAASGPDRVVVKQIGGEIDGTTMMVAGTADLEVGEELVLFLRTDGRFHYLVGMHQGKLGVRRDVAGAWVTRRALAVSTPVSAQARPKLVRPIEGTPDDRRSLTSWLAEVRRDIAEDSAGERSEDGEDPQAAPASPALSPSLAPSVAPTIAPAQTGRLRP